MIEEYQIELKFAVCGIQVRDGIISITPPILKWSKGKSLQTLVDFYKQKGTFIKIEKLR